MAGPGVNIHICITILQHSHFLQVLSDNRVCDALKYELDVICVSGTCVVGVNLFLGYMWRSWLIEAQELLLDECSSFFICVRT